jgi:hypothetical protein
MGPRQWTALQRRRMADNYYWLRPLNPADPFDAVFEFVLSSFSRLHHIILAKPFE